jgi:L-2-hydroxycarboxylate dehydrogenase (NAD+)
MNEASTLGTKPAGTAIAAAALLAFTQDAFAACGIPPADAEVIANAMIEADLIGVDTHGIARLPQYVPWLRGGQINPRAQMRVA